MADWQGSDKASGLMLSAGRPRHGNHFCLCNLPPCRTTQHVLLAAALKSSQVLVAHIDCGQPAYDLGGLPGVQQSQLFWEKDAR